MISESPVVTVHIPPLLRPCVGGHDEVTASGDTVGEVLEAVGHEYPDFRNKVLLANGSLVSGLTVYLGPTSVRKLQGLATPVQMEELVSIVPTGETDSCLSSGRLGHSMASNMFFTISPSSVLPVISSSRLKNKVSGSSWRASSCR